MIIVGLGELGQLLAAAFLKAGYPVYPVTRSDCLSDLVAEGIDPLLVVIAVGEADLQGVLSVVPDAYRSKILLLQNELLPLDWISQDISDPTVLVVWLDKKKGRPAVSVLPNRISGPNAVLVAQVLNALDVPTMVIGQDDLLRCLLAKNLYILTVNIAGLKCGGIVGDLWSMHRELTECLAHEIMDIQFKRLGREFDRSLLLEDMLEGFRGDPDHICMGRSAGKRLEKALSDASFFGLDVPVLTLIQSQRE